jgi:Berberine and berberine like
MLARVPVQLTSAAVDSLEAEPGLALPGARRVHHLSHPGLPRPEPRGQLSRWRGEDGRARDAYASSIYKRLAHLKRRYDPTNVFRHNLNIPPA